MKRVVVMVMSALLLIATMGVANADPKQGEPGNACNTEAVQSNPHCDADNDGVPNGSDPVNGPQQPTAPQGCSKWGHYWTTNDDVDGDCVQNTSDNCRYIWNPRQQDYDGDGIGHLCDVDDTGTLHGAVTDLGYRIDHADDGYRDGTTDAVDPVVGRVLQLVG